MIEKYLIEILIVIAVVLVIVYRLSKYKNKGDIGESRVARRLHKLRGEEYEVFNDVLLRTGRGSSQIDHIVVSIYGIFVIETKNYSGWIHGHENSEYWKQTFYKKKTKFRNPIRQNWGHIYALKKVLSDFKQVTYHPIIVFTGSAELKNISSEIPVIYDRQLIRTIRDKTRIPNISIEQVKSIAGKLDEVNILDKKAKKEHNRQVRNQVYQRKKKEKSKVCPRCDGKLVLRKGPYGKFYGCSNYPHCSYKINYKAL